MSQSIGKGRGNNGGDAVSAVPGRNANWLLGTTVPLTGDDTEEGRQPASNSPRRNLFSHQYNRAIISARLPNNTS